MRIHTPKLKGPHPLVVLAVCMLWPVAAMIGAVISNESSAQTMQESPAATPSISQSAPARIPSPPVVTKRH